jgi:hypothetical protein
MNNINDRRRLGRLNRIVISEWSDQKKKNLWESAQDQKQPLDNRGEPEPEPFTNCQIWQGSTQNGYPSISQGHAKSKIKVHILAAWVKHRKLPEPDQVVSHLCHRKKCINPDHLVIESITNNNDRKGCLKAFKDDQGRVFSCCRHVPACLRRDTDTDTTGNFEPQLIFDPTWLVNDEI